jgi:hypothetical protein
VPAILWNNVKEAEIASLEMSFRQSIRSHCGVEEITATLYMIFFSEVNAGKILVKY